MPGEHTRKEQGPAIGRIAVPGGEIALHRWEPTGDMAPTGVAIVLLHAAASGPRALGRLAERLKAQGHDVFVPALAGYGDTVIAGETDSIAENIAVARHTAAFARAVPGITRVVLAGHSMGGVVALRAALAGVPHDAVVGYEPVAFGALDRAEADDRALVAWDTDIAQRFLALIARGQAEAAVARFVEAWNEVEWERLPAHVRAALTADAPRLARDIAAINGDTTPAAAYAAITTPVLLLSGDRSPPVTRRICMRLAAVLPRAREVAIPGAGHMGPAFAPTHVAAAITAFLCSRDLK